MKKSLIYVLMILLASSKLVAQDLSETYLLVTDRGHYISGETLLYRIYTMNQGSEQISTTFYVELIDSRGQALLKSKIPIGADGGRGSIRIPDGIASGTYYLKGYTRWMRNCSATGYSYTSIQVYDPYTTTVLVPDTSTRDLEDREYGFAGEEEANELLEAALSKNLAGTREALQLVMKNLERYDQLDLTISVVKKDLFSKQRKYASDCTWDLREDSRFIPETRGVSISGRAISAADSLPASYATVYVSMLGQEREFYCNYADSAGRFYFSLPEKEGSYELFISTHHEEYEELELLIDSDFSNEEIQLPSYPVRPDSALAARITEMSLNAQINRQFYPFESPSSNDTIREEALFYGHPTVTVYFADFINLPTLSEYFTEVIPQVSLRKSRNRSRFIVNGQHPDLKLYQPLVLIDGVAIFDMEALLEVSPRLVQRIEIITAPYLRSDVTFGGIISLITKEKNMGYIDLPSSGLLLKYQMLEEELPADPLRQVDQSFLPDARNTLYWEPHVGLEPGEKVSLSFDSGDTRGSYELYIRGLSSEGRPVEKIIPFEVR
jgi:hypothetical protein